VACDLTDRTPKQVETLYRKRSAIETSYRTYREARAATTTTPDPLIRFCTRRCGLSVAESLAGRALDGRRPPTTGRGATFNQFTFELVCGWIRDHLEHRADGSTWETNGVGLPPGYGHGLTEVRPLGLPEQQLSTKCANRAAEKTLTRVASASPSSEPFHTIDLSSKSWCGPRIENRIGNYRRWIVDAVFVKHKRAKGVTSRREDIDTNALPIVVAGALVGTRELKRDRGLHFQCCR